MKTKDRAVQIKPLIYVSFKEGEKLEKSLSPVALRSSGHQSSINVARASSLGFKETSGSDRLNFERDRDRILHCRQFRKLAGKTQLLIAPARGDLRTRLTHTMEVYQIATSIARRFNLNIPLVEAIALGHDTGHTPFGHAGEDALNERLKSIGGFHHAAHSVRTLDRLAYDPHLKEEEYSSGLNLTFAVRQGILKHGWFPSPQTPYHLPPNNTPSWNLAGPKTGSVEAEVVALADEIAYLNHDIDDLISYGFEKVLSDQTVKHFLKEQTSGKANSKHADWQKTHQTFLNFLTNDETTRVKILVRDAIDTSLTKIDYVVNKGHVERRTERLIDFSESLRKVRNLFYSFFKECVYSDVRIKQKNEQAKERVSFLFDFFEKFFVGNPYLLPRHIQQELDESPPWWRKYLSDLVKKRLITKQDARITDVSVACKLAACDVVADLTDKEAIDTFEALREAESTFCVEAVDRILHAFPNKRQMDLADQKKDLARKSLKELFPLGT